VRAAPGRSPSPSPADAQNNLEFTLRLQDFIELCRRRDIQAAIAYSRKHLAPWAPTHMSEIQQGMTLLAFGEKTGVGLYRVGRRCPCLPHPLRRAAAYALADFQNLYDRSRWQTVRAQFRETFLTLYALPSQPLLALALSAGLSALRLPSCAPYVEATPEHEREAGDGSVSSSTTPRSRSPVIPLLPAAPPLHNLEDALFPDLSARPAPEVRTLGDGNTQFISYAHGHGHGHGYGHAYAHLTAPVGGIPTSPKDDLHEHPEQPTGNVDCPTCGPDMKVLAAECAMSHHTNSTIVCRISGRVMDSENEPMAFPNGYVYSAKVSVGGRECECGRDGEKRGPGVVSYRADA
jgi:macrophage erythroblast attacher